MIQTLLYGEIKLSKKIDHHLQDKYQPIIISTSRGTGKTFLMECIGAQKVKEEICGRVISFDFVSAASRKVCNH